MKKSENVSFILICNECFIAFMSQLAISENINSGSSYSILDLYSRILKSNEENLPILKLSISEIIICAKQFSDHFFKLFELMNGKRSVYFLLILY